MEKTMFIKTSDEKVFQANEICNISGPKGYTDGSTKREITFNNKTYIVISEDDYWELEKVLRDNGVFYSLKKNKMPSGGWCEEI